MCIYILFIYEMLYIVQQNGLLIVALLVRAKAKTWLIRNVYVKMDNKMMKMMVAFNISILFSFNQLRHLKSIEMRTNELV